MEFLKMAKIWGECTGMGMDDVVGVGAGSGNGCMMYDDIGCKYWLISATRMIIIFKNHLHIN